MKKHFVYSLLLALSLSSQSFAASWDQSLPLVEGSEKAEAFLKIRNLIPALGEGAINYAIDPVTLFSQQLQIQSMMNASAEYEKLRSGHGELMQFQVLDGKTSGGENPEKVLNWNLWTERSHQIAQSRGLTNPDAVAQEILKTLSSQLLGKSQGIVVGLAQILPGTLKKEFFSASPEAKIKILQENLPAEIVSQGFAPDRLGWTDASITKEEIISRFQQALQVEQNLTVLMVEHYASLQSRLSSPKDYAQIWKVDAATKKSLEQWFISNVAKMIPQEKAAAVTMTLREVPPVVGLFRGFAGNDCATKFSFPFVNSPNEYTFLVYDTKGAVKGYVQGTKVVAEGKNVFYLHTITGPRLSKKETHEILSLFHQEKARFGASEILLPNPEKITTLINFLPVREAIQEVVSTEFKDLSYQDAEIRKEFKETFKIGPDYDDPNGNLKGQRLHANKLSPVNISVSQAMGLESVSTAVEKNVLLGVLMQLRKQNVENNAAILKALVPYAGVSVGDIAELVRYSKNGSPKEEGQPVKEFLDTFHKQLVKTGFDVSEDYLLKNIGLVAQGLLRAPDLLSHPKIFKSVSDSLLDLGQGIFLADFLLENADPLMNKEYAAKFFRSFYNDIHVSESISSGKLISKILIKNPGLIFSNKEILASIVRSKKARQSMISFFRANPQWASSLALVPEAQALLKERQAYIMAVQEKVRELQATTSEAEYMKLITRFKDRWEPKSDGPEIARDLLSMTADHYLSLKPDVTLEKARNLLAGSEKYARTLRRLEASKVDWKSLKGIRCESLF
ncbi:hypothetical protein [Bdellovibrio sp. HCB2-146]|uniref:hypothetical protein n=1 Tax=Bdellovibrio sp. HCB2-146 TaxID=3394362 RepID=UPI0039BC43D5